MGFTIEKPTDLSAAGVPVGVNFTLLPFEPYLDACWNEEFPQHLGRAFTEELQSAWYTNPRLLTAAQSALMPYVRRSLAKLAFARYLPFAEIQLGDDGITQSNSKDRKPASERQVIALRNSLVESGWNALENLLAYLDFHAADFPLYVVYRDAQPASLLPTAKEFSQYYQIFGSRLTYNALKPTSLLLERDVLLPRLGQRWPSILESDELDDRSILRHARTWLAQQTIAEAVPTLAVQIQSNGLRVQYTSNIDNVEYYTPPSETQIARLLDKVLSRADSAWKELSALLDDNLTAEQGRGMVDNDGGKLIAL